MATTFDPANLPGHLEVAIWDGDVPDGRLEFRALRSGRTYVVWDQGESVVIHRIDRVELEEAGLILAVPMEETNAQ